jgi:hypothetical protein
VKAQNQMFALSLVYSLVRDAHETKPMNLPASVSTKQSQRGITTLLHALWMMEHHLSPKL